MIQALLSFVSIGSSYLLLLCLFAYNLCHLISFFFVSFLFPSSLSPFFSPSTGGGGLPFKVCMCTRIFVRIFLHNRMCICILRCLTCMLHAHCLHTFACFCMCTRIAYRCTCIGCARRRAHNTDGATCGPQVGDISVHMVNDCRKTAPRWLQDGS